jgi:hypothetical protein
VRRALLLLAAGGLLAGTSGCGEEEPNFELTTPPPAAGTYPLPAKGRAKLVDRTLTPQQALRLRPVIEGWTQAVATGDLDKAAGYFDLPAIVSLPDQPLIELRTPAVARAFTVSLGCAPRLISVKPDGRYVIGAFLQTTLQGRVCPNEGGVSRISFVFGDPDHPRQFTEWWAAPPGSTGENNPDKRPTDALPVAPQWLLGTG